jgi:hypothetical protein
MMNTPFGVKLLAGVLFVLLPLWAPAAHAFDFENGNSAKDVIIPSAIPAIFQSVSPVASDATLVLRVTVMITNSWFDATAPYHSAGTAVGVYSQIAHRPTEERTNTNRNIAMLYASFRVLNSLLPQHHAAWRQMMESVGLDPDHNEENDVTAAGIGNKAGNAVVAAREQDGMNQLGDEGGRMFNRVPYADYTGYQSVNTAYELLDPSRWQPDVISSGSGIFRVQQFVTPQMRLTLPYTYSSPSMFSTPAPIRSILKGAQGKRGYKDQADEVLQASANLTDQQKMMAELFDNKLLSLGFSALFASTIRGLALEQFVHYDFLTNMAAFDGAITTWNEKVKWDAVRPFSAVRYLYGDNIVTAWGGPGQGTVNLPAQQWRPYLQTADHPEYPSGSSCFCSAHAQASRRYFGDDELGWAVPLPAGSSRIEPGVTPAGDITLGPWATWTQFEQDCGQSRFWAGVHFQDAITAGHNLCRPIGDRAFDFLQQKLAGN